MTGASWDWPHSSNLNFDVFRWLQLLTNISIRNLKWVEIGKSQNRLWQYTSFTSLNNSFSTILKSLKTYYWSFMEKYSKFAAIFNQTYVCKSHPFLPFEVYFAWTTNPTIFPMYLISISQVFWSQVKATFDPKFVGKSNKKDKWK